MNEGRLGFQKDLKSSCRLEIRSLPRHHRGVFVSLNPRNIAWMAMYRTTAGAPTARSFRNLSASTCMEESCQNFKNVQITGKAHPFRRFDFLAEFFYTYCRYANNIEEHTATEVQSHCLEDADYDC